jgi:hypothetical protein
LVRRISTISDVSALHPQKGCRSRRRLVSRVGYNDSMMQSPNSRDLQDVEAATMSFPNAWGCIGPNGKFRPSIDAHTLWVMMNVTAEEMTRLWLQAGVNADSTSSFGDMQNSSQHVVCLAFTKRKKSFFSSQWSGSVSLDFGKKHVKLGSVAGNDQAAMWAHFRAFLAGTARLYDNSRLALESLDGEK